MKSTAPRIIAVDLFSGAGGFTEGLKAASSRFHFAGAVESDLNAATTYALNHGSDHIAWCPIEDWTPNFSSADVDVVVGGPPCQGFSRLGKKQDNDSRNFLWREFARVVQLINPKYFVLENVPAFLKSEQFCSLSQETHSGARLEDYTLQGEVLNSAHFGAPQVRKRAVVIGSRRDCTIMSFPSPMSGFTDKTSWTTVREALRGVPDYVEHTELPDREVSLFGQNVPGVFTTRDLHVTRRYQDVSRERFSAISEGGNRFDLPLELQAPCWRKHTTGASDVMGRLRWDAPSVTIRTEFFKPEKGRYIHPEQDRALTHFEAARIQGFSDHYQWSGSKVQIAKQIGNAVPIPLGKAIGQQLVATISAEA